MTVVVEAAERSGSLITAEIALELGRGVGAVPGPVGSWRSRGHERAAARRRARDPRRARRARRPLRRRRRATASRGGSARRAPASSRACATRSTRSPAGPLAGRPGADARRRARRARGARRARAARPRRAHARTGATRRPRGAGALRLTPAYPRRPMSASDMPSTRWRDAERRTRERPRPRGRAARRLEPVAAARRARGARDPAGRRAVRRRALDRRRPAGQIVARHLTELRAVRPSASREAGLTALQLWQALSEKAGRGAGNDGAALLFTDLVGFSDLGARGRRRGGARAAARRRVGRRARRSGAIGGRIVKRLGDGHMAVFHDGPAAVVRGARHPGRDRRRSRSPATGRSCAPESTPAARAGWAATTSAPTSTSRRGSSTPPTGARCSHRRPRVAGPRPAKLRAAPAALVPRQGRAARARGLRRAPRRGAR